MTSKDKVASATIAANLHRSDLGSVDGFLTGSGPIDGGPDVAVVLGDLKGLRNATKLRIGLTGMSWRWNVDTAGTRSVCRSAWVERANRPKAVSDSIDKALKDEPEGRRVHVRDSVIAALAAKKCKRQAVPSRYQAEFDEHVVYGRIWQYGGTLEFGRQDLGYADSTAVAFRKKVTNPLAVTVGGGVYLPDLRVLLASSIRAEHSFETGPARDHCLPLGGTAVLQCRKVPLGEPNAESPVLWTVEARWFTNADFGLDPRVTVDLAGKRGVGVEFPILARQGPDAGFHGAVVLGWRSKPSDPSANDRLFVALRVGVTFGALIGL